MNILVLVFLLIGVWIFWPEKDVRRCTIDAKDLVKGDRFTYLDGEGLATPEDKVLHVEPSDVSHGFVFIIGKRTTHHLDEEKYVSIRVRK